MEKPPVRKKVFLRDMVKLRPCAVCEADSTGIHFGVFSCEACKSFFRRTRNRHHEMVCPRDGKCNIKFGETKGSPCSACRIQRCLDVGMSLNAVKKGRYTLEKRAETIKDSREYWNTNTSPPQHKVSSTVASSVGPENLVVSNDRGTTHDDITERTSSSPGSDSTIRSLLVSLPGTPLSSMVSLDSDFEKNFSLSPQQETIEAGSGSNNPIFETLDAPRDYGKEQQQNNIHMQNVAPKPDIGTPVHGLSKATSCDNTSETETMEAGTEMFPRANENAKTAHLPSALPNHCTSYSIRNAEPNIRTGCAISRSRQAVANFLSTCFGEDESVKQFFSSINSPVNDLDVALADDDDSTLDKIIDQTIEAFDKQNFMTRGYLAKIPQYQHRFMMEKRERERLFGHIKPMTFSEHAQFLNDTGIDLDGRIEKLERFTKFILVPHLKKVAMYISSLPGVQTLPLEDQFSLLKYSKGEYKITAQFSAFNTAYKLYTIPEGNLDVTMDEDDLLVFHSKETIEGAYKSARALQNLSLTDQEYAMLAAVAIIRPDACVTQEGKEKCAVIRRRLFNALERLLCKRLTSLEAHRTLLAIRTVVETINSHTKRYTHEWDQKFLAHPQIKWPKFIMDLIISPIPSEHVASTAYSVNTEQMETEQTLL